VAIAGFGPTIHAVTVSDAGRSVRLGDAGIHILVQYSDHDHRLIVVVPEGDHAAATVIAQEWERERIARAS